MARLTDHTTRDAEHALRAEISLVLARYARRMLDRGKAHIVEVISNATKEGIDIDGLTEGRAAAKRVIAEYFTTGRAEAAIETKTAICQDNSDAPVGTGESIVATRTDHKFEAD